MYLDSLSAIHYGGSLVTGNYPYRSTAYQSREVSLMSDVPVYMVVNLKVTDPEPYRTYEKGFFGFLKKYGGEFITYDDNPITLEGEAPRDGRMIIFKFPSEQAAKDWYADTEYQALSDHRRAGTTLEFLTLVHGQPPRG